jgi:hypothetical protein
MASQPDPLVSFSDVIRFADVSWSTIPDAPGVYVIYDHAELLSFRKGGGLVDAADARIVRKKGKYPLRAAYRPRPVGPEPRERRADEHHLPRHEHGRRDREPSLHALRMVRVMVVGAVAASLALVVRLLPERARLAS